MLAGSARSWPGSSSSPAERGRQGTLIRTLSRLPELELSVSATTRSARPRGGPRRGLRFLSDDEFARRIEAGRLRRARGVLGPPLRTLRASSSAGSTADPVVLEIELQGARQVRETMPSAVQVFIAPPTPQTLADR
jgi:guanylate kinase